MIKGISGGDLPMSQFKGKAVLVVNVASQCGLTPQYAGLEQLWKDKKANGLAVDMANSRLYSNDAARLNYWTFGSIGTQPTFIAGMYRTNDNITFSATGVNDMTFANGNLYGSAATASTVFGRGIYKISTVSDGMSIGDVLLSRASDLGADLLVMGAYGHSRVRELLLGGVTRTVLNSMTLPVLMSH